jgi:phospholipid transport system transporter-binding protein
MKTVADMALPAVLTQLQATQVAAQLQAAIQKHAGSFVLDASALHQFDSSALAVLLSGFRAASAKGLYLQVSGLPDRARQLAQVYGVADLFETPAQPTSTN